MLDYQALRTNATNIIHHIHPLTNISLSTLQRGKLLTFHQGQTVDYVYQPPLLELYTQFSLQTYFFAFWGILILQILTIFVVDKIWVSNVPKSATLWDRMIHAVQKSNFPFPYSNWHQEKGSCYEHLKRKLAVQQEVLVTILINLLFNMVLLVPLPVFCKIYVSFTVSNKMEIKIVFSYRLWCIRKTHSSGQYFGCPLHRKRIVSNGQIIFMDFLPHVDFVSNCANNLFHTWKWKISST